MAKKPPDPARAHRRELHEKRLRATFGFVPQAPPRWAWTPDGEEPWPTPPRMKTDDKDPVLMLYRHMQSVGLMQPICEHRFYAHRLWRFDFAWLELRLAVEFEGFGMGHQSIASMTDNCEKYDKAAILGWCLLRVTSPMVKDGSAIAFVQEAYQRAATWPEVVMKHIAAGAGEPATVIPADV